MDIKKEKFILASGSPRRISIMKEAGIEPVIIKPGCKENINLKLSPEQTVMALALRKALWVSSAAKTAELMLSGGFWLLASDTVVVRDDTIIGKPKDEKDAGEILESLNGRAHRVISGVCILHKKPDLTLVFYNSSDVYFKRYTKEDIKKYIATGEPMDKAGAYAIQGGFAPFVEHFEGDYDNIVGFPWKKITAALSKL